jgi:predicted metal-binding membrane protein
MPAWDMTSLDMALGLSEPMAVPDMIGGAMSSQDMGTGVMSGPMSAMATPAGWNLEYAGIMVIMWWVMMIAMMLPSAAPMVLLFAAANRRQGSAVGDPLLPTGIFTWGYVAVWGGFSVIATALQWAFESAGILSPMMMNSTSMLLAGVILVFAGLYQLTPVKQTCLRHCRSPLQFLMGHWRGGRWGAFRMGVEHGAFCLGCCWALMALLFFGGIMNLYWIAGLAVIVLLEKTIPAGERLGKIIGGLLGLWGVTILYQAVA